MPYALFFLISYLVQFVIKGLRGGYALYLEVISILCLF